MVCKNSKERKEKIKINIFSIRIHTLFYATGLTFYYEFPKIKKIEHFQEI